MADDRPKTAEEVISTHEREDAKREWRASPAGSLGWVQLSELITPPPPRRILFDAPAPIGPDGLPTHDAEPWMPAGEVGLLVASGGTGKSQLAVQMALSMASGLPLLCDAGRGGFNVRHAGRACVLMAEESNEEIARRLFNSIHAYGDRWHLGRDAPHHYNHICHRLRRGGLRGLPVALIGPNGHPTTYARELRGHLEEHAGEEGWRLIIIDPASRFMGLDTEKDNYAATAFIEVLEWFSQLPGQPTVIACHHSPKGTTGDIDAARGSSALRDGARWMATLHRCEPDGEDKKQIRLNVVKSNYTRAGIKHWLSFNSGGVLMPYTPRPSKAAEAAKTTKQRTKNPEQEASLDDF